MSYQVYGREGYGRNEIVYSCIKLLATSAAEPHVIGRRTVRERARRKLWEGLVGRGASALEARYLVNQLREDVTDHPSIELLNRPNPYMNRYRFWSTIIMHRSIAGNAYAYKARERENRPPAELWPLRPDRVKVIPSRSRYIDHYEYRIGQEKAAARSV